MHLFNAFGTCRCVPDGEALEQTYLSGLEAWLQKAMKVCDPIILS